MEHATRCNVRALEEELARQDLELADAIAKVEHVCRRRGRVPAALPELEAALLWRGERIAPPAAAFFGMRV